MPLDWALREVPDRRAAHGSGVTVIPLQPQCYSIFQDLLFCGAEAGVLCRVSGLACDKTQICGQ